MPSYDAFVKFAMKTFKIVNDYEHLQVALLFTALLIIAVSGCASLVARMAASATSTLTAACLHTAPTGTPTCLRPLMSTTVRSS
jgi:hypothetical protein